ncbi:unnamed protein product [Ambrosiozyma monospora]|uniref:Unnamed protein product n=1 Tax=Ambrosiozyma monospora TaxID=43982 RepID=A0ACB5TX81_AMBMO|nr:unnamed protein product [Ambrosiozyma monospora]
MDEITFTLYTSVALIFLSALVLRLIIVFPATSKSQRELKLNQNEQTKTSSLNPVKLLVLLGSGGHTGEMIRILSQFQGKLPLYGPRQYIISSGDSTSLLKITEFEKASSNNKKQKQNPQKQYMMIPRARGIGDGKSVALYKTIHSFAITFQKLFQKGLHGDLPDFFLCNGPGTAIPIAYSLFFLKFIGLGHTKIIYVESLARVNKLSLTGLLILPITDRFLVQWPQLAKQYRRCEYYGMLV